MTMRDLITLEDCGRRYKFNNLGIKTEKGQNYYMAVAMREGIKELLSLNTTEYKDAIKNKKHHSFLDNNLDDSLFLPLAKEDEIKLLGMQIARYTMYLRAKGGKALEYNVVQDIKVQDELITVSADFIFETSEGIIEVVKLKRRAPELSYKARRSENMPQNNVELYLLQAMGEHLYPGKVVKGCLHHMTGKKDRYEFLPYELKKGYNIIEYHFNQKEKIEVENSIAELFSKSKLSLDKHQLCENMRYSMCPFKTVCGYKTGASDLEEIKELKKAPKEFVLTPSQRKAVTQEEGIIRINAGAGSGKTTVVALRVVELILSGCKPEDILLITFTNKGAEEMREKISYWLKKEGMNIDKKSLNITTFNAWGHNIIQEKYKDLGFTESPKLIEKVEKYDILIRLLEDTPKIKGLDYRNPFMNFRHSKGVVAQIETMFDYIKSHHIRSSEEYIEKTGLNTEEVDIDINSIYEMYEDFNRILKSKNLIEYQDQINLLTELFEYGKMSKYDYKHVIVDEFQDSDNAQLDLILFLSHQPSFKSLMVVGDDAQSIYGFRNTSPENILNFHMFFNEVKDINIVENFRSTPEILNLANSFNDIRDDKIEKTLIASGNQKGDIPILALFSDKDKEYQSVADKIEKLIKEGHDAEDIAVIARTKGELFFIERYLNKKKIPYVIDVPEPLLNNTNVHIARNILVYLSDLESTQGLFEYVFVLKGGFKDMSDKEIIETVKTHEEKIKNQLEEQSKLEVFYSMIESMKDEELNLFVEEIKEREYSFAELLTYINKFIIYEDMKTIEKDEKKYKAVTLTTAHTSKGKEYNIVFVLLDRFRPNRSSEAINEERRTLFVAITRAKKHLYMISEYSTKNNGVFNGSPLVHDLINTGKCLVRRY